MSNNPFKSQPAEQPPMPPPVKAGVVVPPSAPGGLTPILVFCLILGIFGLLGTCLGGVSIAAMPWLEQMIDSSPIPEEQKVFNKINIAAQKEAMLLGLILMVVNLVVATMLIIGSVGCFKRKEASRGFLRLALLAAIVYSLLKVPAAIYGYVVAGGALADAVEKLKNDPNYQDIKSQYVGSQITSIVTVVVTIVLAVAILGFYIWARSYLNKPQVVEHFAAVESLKRST